MPITAALLGLVVMFVVLRMRKGFALKALVVLGSLLFSLGILFGTLPEGGLDMSLAAFGIVETLAALCMWIWIATRKEKAGS